MQRARGAGARRLRRASSTRRRSSRRSSQRSSLASSTAAAPWSSTPIPEGSQLRDAVGSRRLRAGATARKHSRAALVGHERRILAPRRGAAANLRDAARRDVAQPRWTARGWTLPIGAPTSCATTSCWPHELLAPRDALRLEPGDPPPRGGRDGAHTFRRSRRREGSPGGLGALRGSGGRRLRDGAHRRRRPPSTEAGLWPRARLTRRPRGSRTRVRRATDDIVNRAPEGAPDESDGGVGENGGAMATPLTHTRPCGRAGRR